MVCSFKRKKKGATIRKAFQEILNDSSPPKKQIRVNKGIEFRNRSMKSWLQDNHIEMYSTQNGGRFVVAELFI